MKAPIYEPSGKAREYADLAVNLYTGCTNGCDYCYAPAVLRTTREKFAVEAYPRQGVVEAMEKQLAKGGFEGRTIHMCFTCDPYPSYMHTMTTREAIEAVHAAGAHVQILTKNGSLAERDFDILGSGDMFGVTYTGAPKEREPHSDDGERRLESLKEAKRRGIGTWVSCEPVIDTRAVHKLIIEAGYIDLFKIGKLNHQKSDLDPLDWGYFGIMCEELCINHGRGYVIKETLREDMRRWEEWVATT